MKQNNTICFDSSLPKYQKDQTHSQKERRKMVNDEAKPGLRSSPVETKMETVNKEEKQQK